MTTIRVLLCDELPVIRDGMRTLLDAEPDVDVIGTTDNGMEALVLVRTARPDVVLTDLNLRTISGLDMIRRLSQEDVRPNVVVFTRSDTDQTVSDVLHAGASCLLGKDASPQELATAIRAAAAGRTMLAPDIAQRLVTWFRYDHHERIVVEGRDGSAKTLAFEQIGRASCRERV